jgi:exosortase/archaeosortase family protein
MNKLSHQNKQLLLYFAKFGSAVALFYFGTLGVIGLSTPDNAYSPFVANHLNFINPLRYSLLCGAKLLLSAFGYTTHLTSQFVLTMESGNGIRMVYSCVGYGVMSFWAAFIIANKGSIIKKMSWVGFGLAALWAINVLRVSILLVAINKNWPIPLGWDHHTWFNIIAYAAIFLMIYFYDRSSKRKKE